MEFKVLKVMYLRVPEQESSFTVELLQTG